MTPVNRRKLKPLTFDEIFEMAIGQKSVCRLLAGVSSTWIDALEAMATDPRDIEENKHLREAWRTARRLKRKHLI